MPVSRRALLKASSAAVALAALGAGAGVQFLRSRNRLSSATITGPWGELGQGVQWLLPDLREAPMVVPDRPHRKEETLDPDQRRRIRRTRAFTVTTGKERLRGGDPSPAAAPGVFRILAVGDSVTFGWGLAEGESWPRRLEADLLARGHAVEVVNAGVPGQGLEGMRAWLSRVAPRYAPHGVLFCRRPPPFDDPAGQYARALEVSLGALPGARFQVILPPVSRFDPHGLEVYPAEALALTRRIPDIPVLEMTDPFRVAQGDRGCALGMQDGNARVYRLEDREVLVEAPLPAQGLPLPAYALFEDDPTVREALFFDDGHPDAEGCAVFAGIVADRLLAAGWFRGA